MRNLFFKIVSPSVILRSTSVNLWRASHNLFRNLLGVFFSPCSMSANLESLSMCLLKSFKNTSDIKKKKKKKRNTSDKVTVVGPTWLPVGKRAILCSLFFLASCSSHSSPKVVASPKTRVLESGVSVCHETYITSLQVSS